MNSTTFLLVIYFLISITTITAQPDLIYVSSGNSCTGNYTMEYSSMYNGRTRYYQFANGYHMYLQWTTERWELIYTASGQVHAFNNANTLTPPCWSYIPWTVITCEVTNIYGPDCYEIPLPLELMEFKGSFSEDIVTLEWSTASEYNNSGFKIQRSNNGSQWENIGYVKGKNVSSEINNYNYVDFKPLPGLANYYRLIQEDFDGIETLSEIIQVSRNNTYSENISLNIWPNPAIDLLNIDWHSEEKNYVLISIFNSFGGLLEKAPYPTSEGFNTFLISIEKWPKGSYFITISTSKRIISQKFFIQ